MAKKTNIKNNALDALIAKSVANNKNNEKEVDKKVKRLTKQMKKDKDKMLSLMGVKPKPEEKLSLFTRIKIWFSTLLFKVKNRKKLKRASTLINYDPNQGRNNIPVELLIKMRESFNVNVGEFNHSTDIEMVDVIGVKPATLNNDFFEELLDTDNSDLTCVDEYENKERIKILKIKETAKASKSLKNIENKINNGSIY